MEPWNSLRCWIFGHEIEQVQVFKPWSRRLICRKCAGDWGQNDDVPATINWSPELEELYRSHGHRIIDPWC